MGLASVWVAVCGALLQDAGAQGDDVSATAADERSIDLSPPGASDGSDAALSPEARLARAKAYVGSIENTSKAIAGQLQDARKERDVVRVLCLNDKLNQVDVALRSAQARLSALKTAVERGDVDRSQHEYTVLEVLNDRVRVLVTEANQCVGEETGFIGDAEVSVTVDPNLPDTNTGFGQDGSSIPPPPNIRSPIE